jgi:hypothetical protein
VKFLPILKTGDVAYWDTFAGAVPCRVTAITGTSGMCGTAQKVQFTLTAGRGPYKSGEEHEDFGHSVFPRNCLCKRLYTSHIRPYVVQVDQSKELS